MKITICLALIMLSASSVLSVSSHMTVFTSVNEQEKLANEELANITTSGLDGDKIKMTFAQGKELAALKKKVTYKPEPSVITNFDSSVRVTVTNAVKKVGEDDTVVTSYNIPKEALNFSVEVSVTVDQSTDVHKLKSLVDVDFEITKSFNIKNRKVNFDITPVIKSWTHGNDNCAVASGLTKDECADFFKNFVDVFKANVDPLLQGAIMNEIMKNLPFRSNKSENIPSRDANVSINFNTEMVGLPIIIETEAPEKVKGLVYVVDGRTKKSDSETYSNYPEQAPFTNFFVNNGDYQYSISQTAVDETYKMLINLDKQHYKNTGSFPNEIEELVKMFPELAKSYARGDKYTVDFQNASYETVDGEHKFKGTLVINLPELEKGVVANTITINFTFFAGNVFLRSETTDNVVGIYLSNRNSYLGDVSIKGDNHYPGIVYEVPFKNWLLDTLTYIYDQKANKNVLGDNAFITTLTKHLYANTAFYDGSYVIVRDRVLPPPPSPTVSQEKTLKFLEITN